MPCKATHAWPDVNLTVRAGTRTHSRTGVERVGGVSWFSNNIRTGVKSAGGVNWLDTMISKTRTSMFHAATPFGDVTDLRTHVMIHEDTWGRKAKIRI